VHITSTIATVADGFRETGAPHSREQQALMMRPAVLKRWRPPLVFASVIDDEDIA
jgi:hypothetical protein